jgi:hypothetical protein
VLSTHASFGHYREPVAVAGAKRVFRMLTAIQRAIEWDVRRAADRVRMAASTGAELKDRTTISSDNE